MGEEEKEEEDSGLGVSAEGVGEAVEPSGDRGGEYVLEGSLLKEPVGEEGEGGVTGDMLDEGYGEGEDGVGEGDGEKEEEEEADEDVVFALALAEACTYFVENTLLSLLMHRTQKKRIFFSVLL